MIEKKHRRGREEKTDGKGKRGTGPFPNSDRQTRQLLFCLLKFFMSFLFPWGKSLNRPYTGLGGGSWDM